MTLEEAKILANQGDIDSIMALGSYYWGEDADEQNRDMKEAARWYEKGAEFGYPNCMCLTAILLTLYVHTKRKVVGHSDFDSLEMLDKALFWANKANESGFEKANDQIIFAKGEMGIAYYDLGIGNEFLTPTHDEAVLRFSNAIDLLKSIYQQSQDPEVYIYLAFSLFEYGKLVGYNEQNNRLEYLLYHKCVDEYFGDVVFSEIAASFLGIMYTEGRGCSIDYDKAVYYFQKAHNAGFDCSDMLRHFKKKMFGGYTLK